MLKNDYFYSGVTLILEENLTNGTEISLVPRINFSKDVISLIISVVIDLVLVIIGNVFLSTPGAIYLLLGLALIIYGVYALTRVFSDFGSALNYRKASRELNGMYLRKTEPVCPFLKSSYSGFVCRIEFEQPFDIQSDLPKCHNEIAYKKHWEEKSPNLLQKAKETTNRNLLAYLNVFGMVKYEPAIPFLVEILQFPSITKQGLFVVQNATDVDLKILKENFIESFSKIEEEGEEKVIEMGNLETEFVKTITTLTTKGILLVEDERVKVSDLYSDESFSAKWKFYSTGIVKQYSLASLVKFENPDLVPIFLDIYANYSDSKLVSIAKRGLLILNDYLETPLLDLLNDPDLPSDKKVSIIDLASNIESEKIFNLFREFSTSDDETLSYYAISALGHYGEAGVNEILLILNQDPTDLDVDAGRSSLANVPKLTFKELVKLFEREDKFSSEYSEILSSILEELDHVSIKDYFTELPLDEQEQIAQLFEKHNLTHNLEYLVT